MRAFSSLYFFLQILWILDLLTRLVFSQLNYFISVMGSVHFPCRIQGLTLFFGLFVILSCLTLLHLDNLVFLIVYLCVYGGI